MKPTDKNPEIDTFLTNVFGVDRRKAIKGDQCVAPPIGCGKPITTFKDALSAREYRISGLCQECQDRIFNP